MLMRDVVMHGRMRVRLHMDGRRAMIVVDQAMHRMRAVAKREYDCGRKDAQRIGGRESRRPPQPHAPGQKPQHPGRMLGGQRQIVNRAQCRLMDCR